MMSPRGCPPVPMPICRAETGQVHGLFLPIGVLVVATFYFMVSSGADALAAESLPFSIIGAFEKTDVGSSLFFGASIGLVVTLLLAFIQKIEAKMILKALTSGARSMLPAIYILMFAWTIAGIIGSLETGKFMASLASGNIPFALLPAVLFILAGLPPFLPAPAGAPLVSCCRLPPIWPWAATVA